MNHEMLREKVVDLALDALDPGEAREVEAHLAGCPGCAAELASLRGTRSALAALPPLPAPERGEAVLLAAARQAAEAAEARRPGLLPRWFWGAAVGAASAAAVVLVTLQLSGAPPPSRFDEGREALAGRGSAPQPAPEPAATPAPAPQPATRGPEERVAEAKKERLAGAEAAVAPVAQTPAARPLGDAGGRGEIGVLGAAGAAAEREPAATRSASAPRTQASNPVASTTALPDSAPARAKAADSSLAEAKGAAPRPAAAPMPGRQAPRPLGAAGLAEPGAGCPGERTRTLERDDAGRLVRRVRTGALDGRGYRAEERFGPDGRLAGARLLVDGREVALRAGDLEPLPGLRLAPTAAEAEAAPPACGP